MQLVQKEALVGLEQNLCSVSHCCPPLQAETVCCSCQMERCVQIGNKLPGMSLSTELTLLLGHLVFFWTTREKGLAQLGTCKLWCCCGKLPPQHPRGSVGNHVLVRSCKGSPRNPLSCPWVGPWRERNCSYFGGGQRVSVYIQRSWPKLWVSNFVIIFNYM